jgi:hypothetical protein
MLGKTYKMINLLEVIPKTNDAMSFYRGRLPLLRLQKQFHDQISLYPYHNGAPTWDYMLLFDCVFMQRPYNSHHYEVLKSAKRNNLKIWVDYDDLLCGIPTDNPAKDAYGPEEIKMIGDFIRNADVVTVSTADLKKYLAKKYGYAGKMKVIPNALDTGVFHQQPKFKNSKNILWRGSGTHQNDLMEFADPIIDCLNKNEKWRIDFMGYNPFFITNKIKNHTYTRKLSLDKYIDLLPRLNHSICIVPLHECPFNRSKSNIAWIESTYAGAVCLAPDWEEWQKPGVVTYKDKADFHAKLKAMISGKYPLKKLHQQSWQYISENLTLDKVNKLRYELMLHKYQQRYQKQQYQ